MRSDAPFCKDARLVQLKRLGRNELRAFDVEVRKLRNNL